MAPVGHTTMHCPQDTQATSLRFCSKAQPIWVLKPRSLGPMTPMPCRLGAGCHTAAAEDTLVVVPVHMYCRGHPLHTGYSHRHSTPHRPRLNSRQSFCSSQLPATHAGQTASWHGWRGSVPGFFFWLRIHGGWRCRSPYPRLPGKRRQLPGCAAPLTSTTQIRQAPISLISLR